MSGIIKATVQFVLLNSLLLMMTTSVTAELVERSTKTRLQQSVNEEQSALLSVAPSKGLSDKKTQRKARYIDVSDPGSLFDKKSIQKVSGSPVVKSKLRDPEMSAQLKSTGFYFSSIEVYMDTDLDYDNYYSEFSITFDADTDYDSATVYALLYISYDGEPWELYHETDYFNIYGWSSSDYLSVATRLTSAYPSGRYDLLIDLYDEYDNSLVATISPYDTSALADLYLEDTSYDTDSGTYSEYSIFDASITLLDDDDDDGFYHSFSLQFDADVTSGEAQVFAEIWVRDTNGNWVLDNTTSDFIIDGNSTLDTFIIESVWESGYDTGYYDFRVELYDAFTSELLATSASSDNQLFQVPLEDTSNDVQPSGSIPGGGFTSESYESGGSGGMSVYLIMILSILRFSRYKLSRKIRID